MLLKQETLPFLCPTACDADQIPFPRMCVCCELAWAAASYLCCPSEEIQSIMPRLQTHLLIFVHVLNSSPIFSIYSESNFVFKLTPCTLHTNCKLDTLRWVLCTRRFSLASDQEAGKEGTLARP